MLEKVKPQFEEILPVLWRIFKEGWFPLVCALGASVYSYRAGKPFGELSATFSYVFFIVFFFQGQLLRIKKNVRDDKNAEFSRTMLTDIHQVVAEISAQRKAPLPTVTAPATGRAERLPTYGSDRTRDGFPSVPKSSGPHSVNLGAEELFAEAELCLAHGLNSGASLMAAVAFEKAIREIASRLDITFRQPLSRIVDEMEYRFKDPPVIKELRTLIRFRNGLVHAQNQPSLFSLDDARDTVNLFKGAVERLISYVEDVYPVTRAIRA